MGSSSSIGSSLFSIFLIAVIIFCIVKTKKSKVAQRLSTPVKALIAGVIIFIVSIFAKSGISIQIGLSITVIALFLTIKAAREKRSGATPRTYYPSYLMILIVFYVIFSVGFSLLFTILYDGNFDVEDYVIMCILSQLVSAGVISVYFLPYLIANKREHQQTRAIYILNIFAGWTVIVWVVALIWAHTVQSDNYIINQNVVQSDADEVRRFKELYDSGIISEEEYEAKKKQLLNL